MDASPRQPELMDASPRQSEFMSCALCSTCLAGGKTVYRGFDLTFCSSQCRNLVALSGRDPEEAKRTLQQPKASGIPFFSSNAVQVGQ